ncbi:Hsp20/alpha crystallin family protein [Pseudoramibacter sp.]|jgi:HSP20 family molecular chaperone IbpA|uniref:Hsp20/alpha crystallin family protein n=1 Tax=Pseudoramibacter sp. TaxID=2034862 RepID=UPI00345870FD
MLPSTFGENLFDSLFDNAFDRKFFGDGTASRANVMKTDVKENDNAYTVDVELPGYKKDDVSVRFENGTLTVTATKKDNKDEKDDKGQYVRRERYSGSCSRSFYVGEDIKKDDISAKMTDGVLTLTIPKKGKEEIEASKLIQID